MVRARQHRASCLETLLADEGRDGVGLAIEETVEVTDRDPAELRDIARTQAGIIQVQTYVRPRRRDEAGAACVPVVGEKSHGVEEMFLDGCSEAR